MTNPTKKELEKALNATVEKFNPNHDKLGRFTTGSGNVTGKGAKGVLVDKAVGEFNDKLEKLLDSKIGIYDYNADGTYVIAYDERVTLDGANKAITSIDHELIEKVELEFSGIDTRTGYLVNTSNATEREVVKLLRLTDERSEILELRSILRGAEKEKTTPEFNNINESINAARNKIINESAK